MLLKEAEKTKNKEILEFILSSYRKNCLSKLPLKKKKRLGHRAKKRKLSLTIQITSGLPSTLHYSLSSLYDHYPKPVGDFIEWYEETKQYDPEMLAIYNRYKNLSLLWIKELESRK